MEAGSLDRVSDCRGHGAASSGSCKNGGDTGMAERAGSTREKTAGRDSGHGVLSEAAQACCISELIGHEPRPATNSADTHLEEPPGSGSHAVERSPAQHRPPSLSSKHPRAGMGEPADRKDRELYALYPVKNDVPYDAATGLYYYRKAWRDRIDWGA